TNGWSAARVGWRPCPRAIQSVTVLGGMPQRRAAGSMRPVWAMSFTSAFARRGVSRVGRPIRPRGWTPPAATALAAPPAEVLDRGPGRAPHHVSPARARRGLTPYLRRVRRRPCRSVPSRFARSARRIVEPLGRSDHHSRTLGRRTRRLLRPFAYLTGSRRFGTWRAPAVPCARVLYEAAALS